MILKIFDFFLCFVAVISLLVASYLFATDSPSLVSKDGSSLQVQQNNPKSSNSSPVTTTATTSKWKYIVIHHSSTKGGNARIFGRYHREEMHVPDGLIYHFVIGNGVKSVNGEVEISNRWQKKLPGPHCFDAKMNEQSISICLVGDFEKDKPTHAQILALVELLRKLQKDYGIPSVNIIGHNDVDKDKTDCPGKNFPWQEVKSRLR
jgi:hypothetical protein